MFADPGGKPVGTQQILETTMHRLLLATTLLTALSAPALAAYPKGEVGAMREHRAAREMLPRRTERGEINDPFWTPCDYSTNWGPDSCD
jgi:hypothetical protein